MLLDRDNILEAINWFQEEIDDLQRELKKTTNDKVRRIIKDRIVDLADNKFRHELQASAWGLMPRPSLPAPDADIIVRGECDSTAKNE